MKITRLAALLAVPAACFAAAGCGSSGTEGGASASAQGNKPAKGDGTFTVAFVGDRSGPLKTLGTNVYNGLQAAADYLNENGGINGEKVKIESVNDNGDASTSVQVLLKYLTTHKAPDMVWSGIESNSTSALLPVISKRGLFSYSYQDGGGLLGEGTTGKYPHQFTTFPPSAVPVGVVADHFKKMGYKKVGIAEESISIAQGERPYMLKALDERGIKHELVQMPATATDVTPQIDKLKSAGADVLYYNGVAANVGYGMAARAKLGWKVPVVGGMAFAAVDPTSLASKKALDDVKFVNFKVTDSAEDRPNLDIVEQHIAKYGGVNGVGMNVVTLTWDAMMATAAAAQQAKATTPDALTKALESGSTPSEKYATISEYSYTSTNHEPKITDAVHDAYTIIGAGPIVHGRVNSFEK